MSYDFEPLDQEERSVVCRVLVDAYMRYRDLPLRAVCRDLRVFLCKQFEDDFSGYANVIVDPGDHLIESYRKRKKRKQLHRALLQRKRAHRYDHLVRIPGKALCAVKEHTFWHEIGHVLLRGQGLFPRPFGRASGFYRLTAKHWSEERAVEAFGTAMVLYRFGVDPHLEELGEDFIFADETSDWYTQMLRFESNRILTACSRAERERSNSADLQALQELHQLLQKYGSATMGLQRGLPMIYKNIDGCGVLRYHYTSEPGDANVEHAHRGKESWRRVSNEERRLVSETNALRDLHEHLQYTFFADKAADDQAFFNERLARLDRAVQKFQKS